MCRDNRAFASQDHLDTISAKYQLHSFDKFYMDLPPHPGSQPSLGRSLESFITLEPCPDILNLERVLFVGCLLILETARAGPTRATGLDYGYGCG